MVELLKVLAEWLNFFFTDNRYRIIDSLSETSGDAFIKLASDNIIWNLVRERSQIFLECRPRGVKLKQWEWFSTDLLIRLITGSIVESSELTEEIAWWCKNNIFDIEERFTDNRLEETIYKLKEFAQQRSKRLFK